MKTQYIAAAIAPVFFWLAGAFIGLEINPFEWVAPSRTAWVIFSAGTALICLCVRDDL